MIMIVPRRQFRVTPKADLRSLSTNLTEQTKSGTRLVLWSNFTTCLKTHILSQLHK